MAKSPAHTIADLLVNNNLVSYSVTPTPPTLYRITIGRQVDKPGKLVSIYDTGGLPRNPAFRLNYPTLQIRVRGDIDDYAGAYSMINDLSEYLVGLTPQVIDGDRWDGIIQGTDINFLQYDSISRPEFTLNLSCFVEPGATSSSLMHRDSL